MIAFFVAFGLGWLQLINIKPVIAIKDNKVFIT